MKIRHWLMYGSIWGAYRIGKPLPWDNDVDIGFDGEGRFANMTLSEFLIPFTAEGLKVSNKWIQSGTIVIHKEGLSLSVDLFAFYNHGGTMTRRGIEAWIFFLNYRMYHSFPARLVEPELPQMKFGFFNISIPKGGIEILKHLYPYNWWKEVRPRGCWAWYKKEMVFSNKLLLRLIEFYTRCFSLSRTVHIRRIAPSQGMQKGANLSVTLLLLVQSAKYIKNVR